MLHVYENYEKFTTHSSIHNYSTRQAGDQVVPFSRIWITQHDKVNLKLFNKFASIHKDVALTTMSPRKFFIVFKSLSVKTLFL